MAIHWQHQTPCCAQITASPLVAPVSSWAVSEDAAQRKDVNDDFSIQITSSASQRERTTGVCSRILSSYVRSSVPSESDCTR